MVSGLEAEYQTLPAQLARIGVHELGVSALILAGGAHAHHCRTELRLPGAPAGADAVRALMEGRIRVDWRGEIGYAFQLVKAMFIGALGCGVRVDGLRHETRLTLWDAHAKVPMQISVVYPNAPIHNSFAFGENFEQPIRLGAGHAYAVTVQAAPDLGIIAATGVVADIPPELGVFLGGVFSRGPWLYPSERDENTWAQAYMNVVTMRILDCDPSRKCAQWLS